jgi:hypothetical protein
MGKLTVKFQNLEGYSNMKGGKPPLIDAISATVLVSIPNPKTRPNTTIIAEAGIALEILEKSNTIAIVISTNPSMIYNGLPDNQTLSPLTIVLN